MIPVQIRRLFQSVTIPTYATPGSAAIDLRAMLDAPLLFPAGWTARIHTGLAIHIEDPAYCAKIYARSGLSTKHGIVLANSVGVVDSDYQGEIIVCLRNQSDSEYTIQPGERIAQMCLEVVERFKFELVDSFTASERGASGFGSTGRG